jgi:hypothetical protein
MYSPSNFKCFITATSTSKQRWGAGSRGIDLPSASEQPEVRRELAAPFASHRGNFGKSAAKHKAKMRCCLIFGCFGGVRGAAPCEDGTRFGILAEIGAFSWGKPESSGQQEALTY